MTTKPQLFLVALILCCSFAAVHGSPRGRCYCLRTFSKRVLVQTIKKVEVIPISGHCRRIEIIVTRKNDSKVCVDPNAYWLDSMLDFLKKKTMNDGNPNDGNPTAVPSTSLST
ncbi:C-X-C motif chemokine 10-like [Scomber scombrus]|uniref:C-X-C motif chemokine n=1 Tax=Scomber scombrus TaxID=13677 RepID=A0AAV1Q811_SCOSC